MRTYYKLEDYHWEMIKERGLEKGTKVWVAKIRSYELEVQEAIVEGFDIHIEGEVEVRVRFKEKPRNEWNVNPPEYEMLPQTVFMFQVYHKKEQALTFLKKHIDSTITRLNDSINYYKKELQKL